MLLHRRDDFLAGDWPADMAAEAARLKHQVDDAMKGITRRLFRAPTRKRFVWHTSRFSMSRSPRCTVMSQPTSCHPPTSMI